MIMRFSIQLLYKKKDYVFYLDNLFISKFFLKALRVFRIGATGTIRKNSAEISKRLLELKQNNKRLIWGSVLSKEKDGILIFL
jgi:hypothetical protein